MGYKYRHLQEKLSSPPPHFGALLITGPRQSGKSTLGRKLLEQWGGGSEVSFDTPDNIARFDRDPSLFFQGLSYPVLLDEVQNVPQIFPYIKEVIDRRMHGHPCPFILTGSQQFAMMRRVSESLAGRILVKDLFPFCLAEIRGSDPAVMKKLLLNILLGTPPSVPDQTLIISDLWQAILRGGYPPVHEIKDDSLRRDWVRSYVQTYIQRDVRDLSNVQNLGVFSRFVNLVAGRSAHIINFSELGRDIGVSFKTAQSYLSLLETSYLWKSIPPYFGNSEKRLVKHPKGVLLDSGLACFLTGIFGEDSLRASPLFGMIFETFAVSELIKLLSSLSIETHVYHFRTSGGIEVDLVLEFEGKLIPVEIKGSATPTASWGRGISRFIGTFKKKTIGTGYVISLSPEVQHITKDAVNIPIQIFG